MSNKEGLVPIGSAAKDAGISRQSLQYYLMLGLIEPTQVTPTGRRLFDDKAIDRIRLIKKLNESGYPLRAIRDLFLNKREETKGSGS
ncbi:MAG: MerR family transcriptional regulator [Planctomycetes bacterium]|nr:MerR family transcriptional regulator [Planctomycetota bacterium]MCK5175027.1 MerR family transcriptional regulator [Planctomycetota bacterium]